MLNTLEIKRAPPHPFLDNVRKKSVTPEGKFKAIYVTQMKEEKKTFLETKEKTHNFINVGDVRVNIGLKLLRLSNINQCSMMCQYAFPKETSVTLCKHKQKSRAPAKFRKSAKLQMVRCIWCQNWA